MQYLLLTISSIHLQDIFHLDSSFITCQMVSFHWHRPCACDLQSNVTLLTLVTLLGKSQADGHVIRSNITCLITLLSQGTLLDTSDVTMKSRADGQRH